MNEHIDDELIDEVDDCELFADQRQYIEFMATLKLLGCTKVQVEFSGGGDSGEIHEAQAWGNGVPIDLTKHTMQYTHSVEVWSADSRSVESVTEELSLAEILKKLCEDALEETELDWYNNDGGRGCFYVDYRQDPPRLRLEVETYYTTSDSHDFDY